MIMFLIACNPANETDIVRDRKIVVLAGVQILNTQSKGQKIQWRYSRIVVIAGFVLVGFHFILSDSLNIQYSSL